MSIQDKVLQFKGLLRSADFMLTLLIIVVSTASFLLGRFSVHEFVSGSTNMAEISSSESKVAPLNMKETSSTIDVVPSAQTSTQKMYVASKSGTKYHLPWCGSAKQIKEENKIWFATKEEAEKSGYSPASNCKGI